MSERERLRRLHVENRLEELEHKYGPLERSTLPEPDIEPSWGPVGSLLKRTDPELYEHVMRQHRDVLGIVLPAPPKATAPRQQPQPPVARPTQRPAQRTSEVWNRDGS